MFLSKGLKRKILLLGFFLFTLVSFSACGGKPSVPSVSATDVLSPSPAPTPYVQETELYSGPVEHVFTHSLIAFPELAYTNNDLEKRVSDTLFVDFITVKEFKAVLQALYDDGYALVNLNDIYETVTEDGITKVKIKDSFPFLKGKKPLIFSFDDTNYYSVKDDKGLVDKLILKDGKVVTYTKRKDGSEVIRDDNEFVPILDQFVEAHPDFSYDGAKGMICLTGYEGVLGYRTHRILENDTRTEADRQAEIEAAKPVIQALKDSGWFFASHSYKHGNMAKYGEAQMLDCSNKFQNEVIPLIGETKIYVYPYGLYPKPDGSQPTVPQRVLLDAGFQFFCGVGVNRYAVSKPQYGNVPLQDRANIDGQSMLLYQEKFNQDADGASRFPSLAFSEFFDSEGRGISYTEAQRVLQEIRSKK